MPAIPSSTRDSITWRLLDHAGTHWPQLDTVRVNYRGGFAYVSGVLPGGEQIPLCRLRYGGSAHSFGFAIYSAAREHYDDAVLRTGQIAELARDGLSTVADSTRARQHPRHPNGDLVGGAVHRAGRERGRCGDALREGRDAFHEAFAADVNPETAAVMAAAQRPYAAAAFAGTPSGPLAWKTLPCWYLLGTEDKAIPPALQRHMAERANATIVEVPASHVSFVSQPEAATQLILQAVEATS